MTDKTTENDLGTAAERLAERADENLLGEQADSARSWKAMLEAHNRFQRLWDDLWHESLRFPLHLALAYVDDLDDQVREWVTDVVPTLRRSGPTGEIDETKEKELRERTSFLIQELDNFQRLLTRGSIRVTGEGSGDGEGETEG